MAVDEALLASAQAGGVPTLRLYAWRGPWLSLGYAQSLSRERAEACERAGVGVVRRVTGGWAVLHGADLTYAVAAPEPDLPPGLQACYALVSQVLLRALSALGVEAELAARPMGPRSEPVFDCFERASGDEICVGGRKLAGSAQRRAAGAVLQHGSLRLAPDPAPAASAAGSVLSAATSLRELGVSASEAMLRDAMAAAFAAELGVVLLPGTLGAAERALATQRAAAHREKPWHPPAPLGHFPQGPLPPTDKLEERGLSPRLPPTEARGPWPSTSAGSSRPPRSSSRRARSTKP
jgi:lipoate-protein ligase A